MVCEAWHLSNWKNLYIPCWDLFSWILFSWMGDIIRTQDSRKFCEQAEVCNYNSNTTKPCRGKKKVQSKYTTLSA